MLYVLSKEEAEREEEEMDEFLLSLDFNTKSSLVSLLKPLFKQINCDHDWVDLDSYENNMPKNSLMCRKCSLIRKKV